MKILCLTTFLDGRDRFEKDDVRSVADEDGARFIANGWAQEQGGEAAAAAPAIGETTLNVQNSVIGLGDNHG